MASFNVNPFGPAKRFLQAFRAAKAGLKPSQFSPPIGGSRKAQAILANYKSYYGTLRKAEKATVGGRSQIGRLLEQAKPVSMMTPAERIGGILGKGFRKPGPQQLELPGMEGLRHVHIPPGVTEPSAISLAVSHAKQAAREELGKTPNIGAFLKGTSATKYGTIAYGTPSKLAYKAGKLFRPGVRTTLAAGDLARGAANQIRDEFNRPGRAYHRLKVRLYRAKLKYKPKIQQGIKSGVEGAQDIATGTIGEVNAATAKRWGFPTQARLKLHERPKLYQPPLTGMSESTGTGRVGTFDVTLGHAPIARIRTQAEDYGRALRITPIDVPNPSGQASLQAGAPMATRVKHIRAIVSELRKNYPGAYKYHMTRLKHGVAREHFLKYTRPDRPHQ